MAEAGGASYTILHFLFQQPLQQTTGTRALLALLSPLLSVSASAPAGLISAWPSDSADRLFNFGLFFTAIHDLDFRIHSSQL